MNTLPFLLARRMLFSHSHEKGISTMTLLCFIGIFIGTFSLALITAIMHGFEIAIEKKMQGIHADIIIEGPKNKRINFKGLSHVLSQEFPEISAHSPHTSRYALLHTPHTQEAIPTVVMLTALIPETEENTTALAQKIITPLDTPFITLFSSSTIVIGKQCALAHNLTVGDSLDILFMNDETITHKKVTFDSHTVTVAGIFQTGIDEYDSNVIYCSFSLLKTMFPQATKEHISLSLQPHTNETALIEKLRTRTHLHVYSWKDLYPSLIAAQKLEKYASFFVIALILLVASMNIISLMYMHITHKRLEIALLKTLGMHTKYIFLIFWIIGLSIGLSASVLGIVAACSAAYLMKLYPFITLPDTYYVTHLPIAMTWKIVIAVFFVVIIFSCIAIWIALQQIKTINSSRVLRFEG